MFNILHLTSSSEHLGVEGEIYEWAKILLAPLKDNNISATRNLFSVKVLWLLFKKQTTAKQTEPYPFQKLWQLSWTVLFVVVAVVIVTLYSWRRCEEPSMAVLRVNVCHWPLKSSDSWLTFWLIEGIIRGTTKFRK